MTFLHAAFEAEASDSRGIIEILSHGLHLADEAEDLRWRQLDRKPVCGLELSNPKSIAFAALFPSIDRFNPLPAGTVEVLAQDERWTGPPVP